jgi:hypothetical protein
MKCLDNSEVAERLASSQEGSSSMELVDVVELTFKGPPVGICVTLSGLVVSPFDAADGKVATFCATPDVVMRY